MGEGGPSPALFCLFSSPRPWEMKTVSVMMDRAFSWSLTFLVDFC